MINMQARNSTIHFSENNAPTYKSCSLNYIQKMISNICPEAIFLVGKIFCSSEERRRRGHRASPPLMIEVIKCRDAKTRSSRWLKWNNKKIRNSYLLCLAQTLPWCNPYSCRKQSHWVAACIVSFFFPTKYLCKPSWWSLCNIRNSSCIFCNLPLLASIQNCPIPWTRHNHQCFRFESRFSPPNSIEKPWSYRYNYPDHHLPAYTQKVSSSPQAIPRLARPNNRVSFVRRNR